MARDYFGEQALLEATLKIVRDVCGYTEDVCRVEYDEFAPAEVGQIYVAIMSNGVRPGRTHSPSGTVIDETYGIEIAVVMRVADVPKDSLSDFYLHGANSLNSELGRIRDAVDFSYDLMNDCNEQLKRLSKNVSAQPFSHPLVWQGYSARPRIVGSEYFSDIAGEQKAGLVRSVQFDEARRIQNRY